MFVLPANARWKAKPASLAAVTVWGRAVANTKTPLRYHWRNLETLNTGISSFNAYHDAAFGDPDGYSPRHLDKVADALIERWNRQQPKTWYYWREGREPNL